MGIINDLLRRPERVVLQSPRSKTSIFKKDKSHQAQLKTELASAVNSGDINEVGNLLAQINSSRQTQKDFFKAKKIGVDDKSTLELVYQITQLGNKDLRDQAIEMLFSAATEKANEVIPGYPDDADEILTDLKNYLVHENEEATRQSYASQAASKLGYHLISDTQKVILPSGANASVKNNLLHQMRSSRGISNILFRLINDSNLTEDNKVLQDSLFTGNADTSIENNAPARENLKARIKKEILPKFKSLSSTNFNLTWEEEDPITKNPVQKSFDLENFLNDVCDKGPEEAIKTFIASYTKLVEYKENQKASDSPDLSLIKKLEKEQQKALKFLFDDNKLKATESGKIIHETISQEMQKSGLNRFLLSLYKSITCPNEVAEVKAFARGFEDAFKQPLELDLAGGSSEAVQTMSQYRDALSQKEKYLTDNIDALASDVCAQNNIPTTQAYKNYDQALTKLEEAFSNFQKREEQIWEKRANEDKLDQAGRETLEKQRQNANKQLVLQFEQSLRVFFPDINFGAASALGESSLTSLKSFTRSEIISNDFREIGSKHEVHIKQNGAGAMLTGLRSKYDYQLDPAETLILEIIDKDRQQLERDNQGLDTGSFIESLMERERYDCIDVNSTLVAGFELIRKIEASGADTSIKQDAQKMILRNFLGLDPSVTSINNNLTEDESNSLYDLHQQVFAMNNYEDHIRVKAKENYTKEMGIFMKHALPSLGQEAIDQASNNFNKIKANIEKMENSDLNIEERMQLELDNLRLIGVGPDESDPLSFDGNEYFNGTFLDSSEDSSLVSLFLETFQAIISYLKSSTSGDY